MKNKKKQPKKINNDYMMTFKISSVCIFSGIKYIFKMQSDINLKNFTDLSCLLVIISNVFCNLY